MLARFCCFGWLVSPSFDFVFLLLAQESPSELGSPLARSSFPTLGRASELSLLSLIGNVHRALIQLVTPSEVAIAVSIAAMVWIMNFQVSRFFIFLRF